MCSVTSLLVALSKASCHIATWDTVATCGCSADMGWGESAEPEMYFPGAERDLWVAPDVPDCLNLAQTSTSTGAVLPFAASVCFRHLPCAGASGRGNRPTENKPFPLFFWQVSSEPDRFLDLIHHMRASPSVRAVLEMKVGQSQPFTAKPLAWAGLNGSVGIRAEERIFALQEQNTWGKPPLCHHLNETELPAYP